MLVRFLAACRHLLIIPVIGCVALMAGVVFMGAARIVTGAALIIQTGDYSAKAAKAMSLAVIEVIDLFLIGSIAYITAIGMYKLFIGGPKVEVPMRLKINNLKDLEDKIIGVIVAALAVAFLGHAAGGDEAAELLNYGGGIAVVVAALAFFMKSGEKKADKDTG